MNAEHARAPRTARAAGFGARQGRSDPAGIAKQLGKPQSFAQVSQSLRGGMVGRVYVIRFSQKAVRAWTYEMPDGKLEQFQVAVQN